MNTIIEKTIWRTLFMAVLATVTLMSGCSGGLPGFATPTVTPSQTPTSTPEPTMTPSITPSPTPTPIQIMVEGQGVALQEITVDTAENLERITQLETGPGVQDLLFLPDGETLVVAKQDGIVQLWDVLEGSLLKEFQVARGIKLTQYSEGKLLFVPCNSPDCRSLQDMSIASLNLESGEIETIHRFKDGIWGLSADGNLVALAALERVEEYQEMEIKEKGGTEQGSPYAPNVITYTVQYQYFSVEIWDISSDTPVLRDTLNEYILLPDETLPVVNFDQDGTAYIGGRGSSFFSNDTLLASATGDGKVIIWDVEKGTALMTLADSLRNIIVVDFSPNRRLLASYAFNDTGVAIWGVK